MVIFILETSSLQAAIKTNVVLSLKNKKRIDKS